MTLPLQRLAGVPVVWKGRAFDHAVKRKIFRVDEARVPTIAEIVASIPAGELPRGFAQYGEARINDELIPRGIWHLVRPRFRHDVPVTVMLTMPLRGGGGGGGGGSSGGGGGGASKNPLATVATIAVLLVAAAVSGGIGGVWGAVAATAIIVGGQLLIHALVPPPSLSASRLGSSSFSAGEAASQSSTSPSAASLGGNTLSPSSPMPRVVGTMRVFPPLLCRPLVEIVGDLEYAEAVFGLCGPHALSAVRVGDTSADSIAELETQLVSGTNSTLQTLVTRQSFTIDANAELLSHVIDPTTQYQLLHQTNPAADVPQPQPFVSRSEPDEIWINLQWGEGLFNADDTTFVINQAFRVQIRARGDSTWINLPEVHFSQNTPGSFQKSIRIVWDTFPNAPNTPPSNQGPVFAFKSVAGQDGATATPATSAWTAHSSFSNGSGSDVLSASTYGANNVLNTELFADKVVFYLDAATFPQGTYEIQITRSMPYRSSSFVPATYLYGGVLYDFFYYYTSGGVHRIPVDQTPYHDRVVVTRVSSIWNENPVQSADFATISVRVHSRALSQLSVLASGYVHDWDGSGWNTLTTTSNPAPHFREVLAGSLGATPVPASLINDDELVAWRTHCTSMDYTVNAVIEGKTYNDALQMIAGAGYARFRHNEKYGVFLDKDRGAETPIQIFTPRNMSNFQWARAFTQRTSGIRANYVDADDNYNTAAETIVYDVAGVQDSNRLSQISYDGLVHQDDIEARATFDLRQAKYRFTFYQGDVDWESLVCQRGDLVAVQHDILLKKAGFARISSVTTSGSNATGLVLDGSIPVYTTDGIFDTAHLFTTEHIFDLGQSTGVAIRLKGAGGIIVKEVTAATNGAVSTISFVTPFADTDSLDEDCLVSAGPLGTEYKRLIVYGIQPKQDLMASITFVDEAPQLWQ